MWLVKFNHCYFQRGNKPNQWKYKFLNLPLSSLCSEGTWQIIESSLSTNKLSSTLSLGFGIDTTQLIRGKTSFRDLKTKTLRGKKCLKYLITYNSDNLGLWIRKSSKFTHSSWCALQAGAWSWRSLRSFNTSLTGGIIRNVSDMAFPHLFVPFQLILKTENSPFVTQIIRDELWDVGYFDWKI